MADTPEARIDEAVLMEWFEFGWAELIAYLTKYARFLELYPESEQEEAHG